MNRTAIIILVIILLVAAGVAAAYFWLRQPAPNPTTNPNYDLYTDQNGCVQSHSGGNHPDYCVHK